MIPGVTALSARPLSSLPPALDQSTPDPFVELLKTVDSTKDLIFLLVARPFDPTAPAAANGLPPPLSVLPLNGGPGFAYRGAEQIVRASARGYTTAPSDTPPHTHFPPRLISPLSRQASIPAGALGGGSASESFGVIELANGDGRLDDWLDYVWDGRMIEILAGGPESAFIEFGTLLEGTSDGLSWTEDRLRIRVRDGREAFAIEIPPTRYEGTGGAEGGADLVGRAKPQALGTVTNAMPVLVDATALVYQVGTALRAVEAVRDRGVALTDAGDVPDVFATTVAGGSFKTDLASGLIRLGATPAGTVTADVRGPIAAGDTAGSLLRYIATTLLGASSITEDRIELGSFADLDSLQPAAVGLYLDAPELATSVADRLMAGIGAWWTFDREGRLRVGRLDVPSNPVRTLTSGDIDGLRRDAVPPPAWRVRIDHDRAWTVQGDDDLAASVDAAAREQYGRAFRSATAADNVARGAHRLARDVVVESPIVAAADAAAEARRVQSLFGVVRDQYRVSVPRGLFKFSLGQSVTLQVPRFGLDAGKDLVVIGLVEDIRRDRADLTLWG